MFQACFNVAFRQISVRSLQLELPSDLPETLPLLWIDSDQIHQVVVNLVVNAHQALEAKSNGDRCIRIVAEYEPGAQMVRLSISDNGAGIPPNIRSRIFDPISRRNRKASAPATLPIMS